MDMHKPSHPGEVIRALYLEPLNLTVTNAAKALGVTRKAFSELLNGKSSVSINMALRLSRAFQTTPELWLNMQQNYDLWYEKRKARLGRVKVLIQDPT